MKCVLWLRLLSKEVGKYQVVVEQNNTANYYYEEKTNKRNCPVKREKLCYPL